MDCLLAVCITITAQLGFQSGFELKEGKWSQVEYVGNDYDAMIGRFNIIADHGKFFVSGSHVSGLSVGEGDMGMNWLSAGKKLKFGPWYVRNSIGIQSYSNEGSNDYGFLISEIAIGIEWKGLAVECSKLSGMEMCVAGIKTTF